MNWTRILVLTLIFLTVSTVSIIAFGENTTTTTGNVTNTTLSVGDLVTIVSSNPKTGAVILIEFLLGMGLGYTAMKALKYILAFIGILFLGSALSVWSLGSSTSDIATKLGMEVKQLMPMVKGFVTVFSAVIVGPASIGFFVGIILAAIKK